MSEPVYFLRLEIENVRCFGPKTTLDLSDGKGNWKKWTVILGDNGTGKSTLLQVIASFENREHKIIDRDQTVVHSINEYRIFNDVLQNKISLRSSLKKDLPIFIAAQLLRGNEQVGTFIRFLPVSGAQTSPGNPSFSIFGYGANRMMDSSALSPINVNSPNSESLFNNEGKLINAEEWLLQLDYAASKESDVKNFAIDKRNQVKQILIDLLPDIEKLRITEPTKQNLKSTVEFHTHFGWVTIHQLSLGYKTMVAWMVDLAARMFERYPDSDNPLAEPAVVLVDEIDLHLHPKWQRKIFDYLSERFPKTQFIVTAHSPLVVQSAPQDANIVLLRKEGDHVVIDNDMKSVQNWRLDQILTSDLFGIESARGPETEQWLGERKELLQKQSLTVEEKDRLNELNQKARNLPTADNKEDIEAMELIRKAADYLKNQNQKA